MNSKKNIKNINSSNMPSKKDITKKSNNDVEQKNKDDVVVVDKIIVDKKSDEIETETDLDKTKDDGSLKKSNFMDTYNENLEKINDGLKMLTDLKKQHKQLLNAHNREFKNYKPKRKGTKTPTGFLKKENVPHKIAKWLNIDENDELPRTAVTSLIYSKLKKEKQYYENDKRVLRANDDVLKLFGLDISVNDVTDAKDPNGFTFFTIQKHLAKFYKPTVEST